MDITDILQGQLIGQEQKGSCKYNYKDMPLFINNLIGAMLNSKRTKLIGCHDTKHIQNDVTHI